MSHDPDWLPLGIAPEADSVAQPTEPEVAWTEPEPLGRLWLPDGTAVHVWAEQQPFGFVSRHRR